jgi:hypothetical protein
MKTRLSITLALFALFFFSASFAYGQQTDLSMRRALYFTGAKTDHIDLKNDRYVAENKVMTLKKSDATSCEGDKCTFNIGFIAVRTPGTGELSTYGLLMANSGYVGNTVYFENKATTRQGVLPLKLAMGKNKVTFQIDPYNKTPETDKSNNGFSVWITVEP